MAGRLIKAFGASITAATSGGILTFTSTTGFYAGAHGWITNTGQTNRKVVITDILSSTQLAVRFDLDPRGDTNTPGEAGSDPFLFHVDYGRSNVAAYNGGRLDIADQLIYNPNDAPAP